MSGQLKLRAENLHWRSIGPEVVILDSRAQRYLALNRSGGELWCMLVDGATRPELIARLRIEYGIAASQAEADVDSLIAELSARSLLSPAAATD